jgi:pimeloyl-ACP methyl ester carboxylesterase
MGRRRRDRTAKRAAVKRFLLVAAACACAVGCGGSGAHSAVGSFVGAVRLPAGAAPVQLAVQLRGARATVWMGGGHPARSNVAVSVQGSRLRFSLPGLPAYVVFDGAAKGRALVGTVSQGNVHGTFRLTRGTSRVLPLLGLYRSASGAAVTVVRAAGFTPWLVELPSGRVHGIGPSLTVGARLGDAAGDGSLRLDRGGLSWHGVHYNRVALRQREVRVGANAATLTLPPGNGPFPAVALVHGSGATTREEFQVFSAYCALLGIAVLADDKRGVGQSTGVYPGERATDAALDALARDAQAEVRFLAALPQVDAARVGLLGDSQAGWVVALAAARERAVRWAVPLVGPTVSVGETDLWGDLAGQSQSPPGGTRAAMLAQVRAQGPSGFDPRPRLASLEIPVLWVYGADDRNVPTVLCVAALEALKPGHDFRWLVLPMTHALLELPSGLYSSLAQSPGFAPQLYPAVGAWLRSRGIVR